MNDLSIKCILISDAIAELVRDMEAMKIPASRVLTTRDLGDYFTRLGADYAPKKEEAKKEEAKKEEAKKEESKKEETKTEMAEFVKKFVEIVNLDLKRMRGGAMQRLSSLARSIPGFRVVADKGEKYNQLAPEVASFLKYAGPMPNVKNDVPATEGKQSETAAPAEPTKQSETAEPTKQSETVVKPIGEQVGPKVVISPLTEKANYSQQQLDDMVAVLRAYGYTVNAPKQPETVAPQKQSEGVNAFGFKK